MPESGNPIDAKLDTQTHQESAGSAADDTFTIPSLHIPEEAIPTFAAPTHTGEVGTLGPYRILKAVGHGGMGKVYLAFDTRLNRKLALKIMLPKFAVNPTAKERFLREARAAAQITHDNVVTVYEADERNGVPYIAMQLLQGYPLDEYLRKKGNPTIAQVLRVARETVAGLAAAHQIGLVHRDIKPANLWLEAPNGRVKVLDFGLAKPLDESLALTRNGALVGTPAYMSPEQAQGLKVDARTDLYSLGTVLYQLCTGQNPFAHSNPMDVLTALVTDEAIPVRKLNPEVPEALAQLIHQLLAKDPDDRPQTADEVGRRIRVISDELVRGSTVSTSSPGSGGSPSEQGLPQVVYVPLPISTVPDYNAFAELSDDETKADTAEAISRTRPVRLSTPTKTPWVLVGLAIMFAVITLVGIVMNQRQAARATPDDLTERIDDSNNDPRSGSNPNPTTAITDPAPDRHAAEWVCSNGGAVQLNFDHTGFDAVANLPKEPFRLTGVFLPNKPAITDEALVVLRDCKQIEYFDARKNPIGDAGLAHLAGCPNLNRVFLSFTKVGDRSLELLQHRTHLKDLHLSETRVTDQGILLLARCRELSQLHLQGTKITDRGLGAFRSFYQLTELNLARTAVTDTGLSNFKDSHDLVKLHLNGTAITDEGLAHFQGRPTLQFVDVRESKVTRKYLEQFHKVNPTCEIVHDGGVLAPQKK